MTTTIDEAYPRDEQASGRFLAALGGPDEAELVHFRALVASESYGIAALDLARTIVSWSHGAQKLFGYSAEDMVGSNLAVLLTEIDQPIAQLPQRISRGETVDLEARLRHADGHVLDTQLTATPIHDAKHEVAGMALLIRDVSAAKEVERRLRDASQLEVMARVAAGVAHDINNVLAIVRSYVEFVAVGPLTAAQASDLRLAQEAAQRGAVLTGQLLALNRPRDAEIVVADLNEVLVGVEELLRRTLGPSIELSTRVALSPLKVRKRRGQLDQILLNLILNARDAMPSGGKLELSLQAEVVADGHEAASQVPHGAYARLRVRDSGIGMDAATRARIFEPFFTTKPRGKGSGLGLVVVQEALREMRGAMFVDSAIDQGTTFTLYLPLVELEATNGPVPMPSAVGGSSLLVVDSDPVLRAAIVRILRTAGYSTLEAADAAGAERIVRVNGAGIRAVITDVSGPLTEGFVSTARELRPDLSLIYLSGQAATPSQRQDDVVFVSKPFASAELLAAVAGAITASPTVRPTVMQRAPTVLVVDDDQELSASLVRVLAEADLQAQSCKSGLHALQLLKKGPVDVIVADQSMPGLEGTKLLELVLERFPSTARILFTADASPDIVLSAVNRARVSKVLLKNMHPVSIREEIATVALETMKRRAD